MRNQVLSALMLIAVVAATSRAQVQALDHFDSLTPWSIITADGVSLKTSLEPGPHGNAIRLDYDFTRGSGYAIIRKEISLPLPENYRFSFALRGAGPTNTLEVKLVDPTGDNVWWVNKRSFDFPKDWETLSLKRRHFTFAWGPSAGAPLDEARHIELVITATTGGSGTVWFDDLSFEPLPPAHEYSGTPRVEASSNANGKPLSLAPDGALNWSSAPDDPAPTLTIDFGEPHEFGGCILGWSTENFARQYTATASPDGESWSTLAAIQNVYGGLDYLWLPEVEARFIRIAVTKPAGANGVTLSTLALKPLSFGDSRNELYKAIAADSPRGWYPKYFLGEASYWTVIGTENDRWEALINEEGMIETDRLSSSLEPFIYTDNRLLTWADAKITQSLEDGYLPIPRVTWSLPGLELTIKAFADRNEPSAQPGERSAEHSTLFARYELKNTGDKPSRGTLSIATRPFQVTPPYQNLNITGGVTQELRDRSRGIASLSTVDGASISRFTDHDMIEHLSRGTTPVGNGPEDLSGVSGAAYSYEFALAPGRSQVTYIAIGPSRELPVTDDAANLVEARLKARADAWRATLNKASMRLPKEAGRLADIARSNLAYILINKDGPGIQPGSRCYERTWIRDGSLTSSALLSFGHADVVRDFLDWFAPFQYEDGKVPCCVDTRGPDPVPEHDSHGQYIFAIYNYYQFTKDRAFLRHHYPRILKAVSYFEQIRAERMTPQYQSGSDEDRAKFGLVPESISHEGYSAKPMHSYWDDLFTLKGLKDAAAIAEVLEETADAARLATLRDSFRETLVASMRLAMQLKGIDYIPGCVELGDFDATSTTVALFPCDEQGSLPQPQLSNTFEKYWDFFRNRRDGVTPWDGYTPYETRAIGAFIRLGQRERAHALLDWFLTHQRPAPWNHWAEVVWNNPAKQGFIGDMPHTWVGSDFLNAFRSMFVYERDDDGALILLAGIPESWLRAADGLEVKGWPTHFGNLSYEVNLIDGHPTLTIEAGPTVPPAGIILEPPSPSNVSRVRVNGVDRPLTSAGEIIIDALPAQVRFEYRD